MKRGKRRTESSFDERVDDFSEEVEMIGKRVERRWHSAFGFVGPLISSIFGIIVLAIGELALGFMAANTGAAFLLLIQDFLNQNLGVFFLLFLFFNYAEYFSRAYRRAYRPFSPLVKAAGIAVVVWIVASGIIISGISLGLPLKGIASFALDKLSLIFAFFAIVGYIVLLVSRPEKERREEVFMARGKQSSANIKRLYRSGKDKILGGVCGGIAEYLDIDPVVIRLLWVVGTLVSIGTGILIYIIAWIIIPRNPKHKWN